MVHGQTDLTFSERRSIQNYTVNRLTPRKVNKNNNGALRRASIAPRRKLVPLGNLSAQ